jgi:tetratricopeptide (TPR) repeat protein
VYCQAADGRHVVATGFITCGRPGAGFVRAIHLPEYVEAHVTSLVLDPGKVDETKLAAAYRALDWDAPAAIRKTSQANDLLERQDPAGAARVFREALALCPHVPAAHNGLAWALLEGKEAKAQALAEALREAKVAVEQTEELDYSALDTLARAHQRNGDKGAALEAVRKALKLKPENADLRRRREAIEAGVRD